jgi:hypothetical protein
MRSNGMRSNVGVIVNYAYDNLCGYRRLSIRYFQEVKMQGSDT